MTLQERLHHTRQIANAIQRHDEFYTLEVSDTTKHVLLPTPQVCGTMIQQRTYAVDKAQEILKSY